MHEISGFYIYNIDIFPGIIHPHGAWTQTPISAWLASVPIVPVLRNDHRSSFLEIFGAI